jgi:hypothetical protein
MPDPENRMKESDSGRLLRPYFEDVVHETFERQLRLPDTEDVQAYLADILTRFFRLDGLYAIRDASGQPLQDVYGMAAEGDIRQRADSFAREREVHKHIGDFLLFWSGMFPERARSVSGILDPVEQGRFSYYVASTHDYPPHEGQAKLLGKLSSSFEECRQGLALVRTTILG